MRGAQYLWNHTNSSEDGVTKTTPLYFPIVHVKFDFLMDPKKKGIFSINLSNTNGVRRQNVQILHYNNVAPKTHPCNGMLFKCSHFNGRVIYFVPNDQPLRCHNLLQLKLPPAVLLTICYSLSTSFQHKRRQSKHVRGFKTFVFARKVDLKWVSIGGDRFYERTPCIPSTGPTKKTTIALVLGSPHEPRNSTASNDIMV